jgi:hypothetical protein
MAAGQGFKTFVTGEVLTAGDVNGYLMQGINVFTNATARDAAITAPAEGQFAFTKDNNSLWYYDGAAWVASGATGDIEGVTAGVGISGGGTSGTVTVTNSMATAIDAKGDLVPGTGADTFARLAVGANNTILTADSSEATGMKWAAPAGGGKVLQVVQGTTSTSVSIATTSLTDSGITATITPTSASSKVLVLVNAVVNTSRNINEGPQMEAALLRGGTTILDYQSGDRQMVTLTLSTTSNINITVPINMAILDTPATTSATIYKVQGSMAQTGNTAGVRFQAEGTPSTIILMEIGA